ncbi:MAG: hypothetical protein R3F05_20110 [Planctomycetota bacterium]
MSVGRWLVWIVLLGAAFGAGHMVGSSGAEHAAPDLATSSAPAGNASSPAATPLRGTRPALATTAGSTVASSQLVQAVQALEPIEVPVGSKRFDVHVETDLGAPLPGVLVRAVPELPKHLKWPEDMPWEERYAQDVATQLHYQANQIRWRQAAALEGTTDAAGTCVLEGALDAKYQIRATLEGWTISAKVGSAYNVTPDAELEFVAAPRTGAYVDVLMPDGAPAETAMLMFSTQGRGRGISWSSASSLIEMPPGVYELTVTSGAAQELRAPVQSVSISRDEPPPRARVQLAARTVIRGRVKRSADDVPMLMVRIVRVPDGRQADDRLLDKSSDPEHAQSDDGRLATFMSPDLEPGRYLIGLYRGWNQPRPALTHVVDVVAGLNEVDLELPPPARGEYAIVRVRGPGGEPVAGAQFSTSYASGDSRTSSGGAMYVPRADGEYWVFHQNSDDPAAKGMWSIQVRHPRYGEVELSYTDRRRAEFDVQMQEPATGELLVKGLARSGVKDRVKVALIRDDGQRAFGSTGRGPDEEGRLPLVASQPGTYGVRLVVSYDGHNRAPVGAGSISVRSSKQDVSG